MTAHMTMYDATVRDSRVKSLTTFSDEYVVLVGGLVGHERVLRESSPFLVETLYGS